MAPGRVALDRPTIENIASFARESEIIGISSMSRASKRAKALIDGLKPLRKLIVWGGMHPTIFPEDCALHADLICRGEGEEFMVDLADRLAARKGFSDIPNGAFLKDGRVQLNDLRPLISDLDSLRFPDFSFEKEHILNGNGQLLPHGRMRESPYVLFSGSRGCVYSCHYCANSQLKSLYKGKGRYARKMSVTAFIDATRECRRLFPRAKYIYFTDEDFLARPVEEPGNSRTPIPRKRDFRSNAWPRRSKSMMKRSISWQEPECGGSMWEWRAAAMTLSDSFSIGR